MQQIAPQHLPAITVANAALTTADTATSLYKEILASGDPGFTITGIKYIQGAAAFTQEAGNTVTLTVKHGSNVIATLELPIDLAANTSAYASIAPATAGDPTFVAGDTLEVVCTTVGTPVVDTTGGTAYLTYR